MRFMRSQPITALTPESDSGVKIRSTTIGVFTSRKHRTKNLLGQEQVNQSIKISQLFARCSFIARLSPTFTTSYTTLFITLSTLRGLRKCFHSCANLEHRIHRQMPLRYRNSATYSISSEPCSATISILLSDALETKGPAVTKHQVSSHWPAVNQSISLAEPEQHAISVCKRD